MPTDAEWADAARALPDEAWQDRNGRTVLPPQTMKANNILVGRHLTNATHRRAVEGIPVGCLGTLTAKVVEEKGLGQYLEHNYGNKWTLRADTPRRRAGGRNRNPPLAAPEPGPGSPDTDGSFFDFDAFTAGLPPERYRYLVELKARRAAYIREQKNGFPPRPGESDAQRQHRIRDLTKAQTDYGKEQRRGVSFKSLPTPDNETPEQRIERAKPDATDGQGIAGSVAQGVPSSSGYPGPETPAVSVASSGGVAYWQHVSEFAWPNAPQHPQPRPDNVAREAMTPSFSELSFTAPAYDGGPLQTPYASTPYRQPGSHVLGQDQQSQLYGYGGGYGQASGVSYGSMAAAAGLQSPGTPHGQSQSYGYGGGHSQPSGYQLQGPGHYQGPAPEPGYPQQYHPRYPPPGQGPARQGRR